MEGKSRENQKLKVPVKRGKSAAPVTNQSPTRHKVGERKRRTREDEGKGKCEN
jgi:hypothetical protein